MTLKVLVIDDDPDMTKLLTLLLNGYDFEVISANGSKLGLELVRSENPNLVTLDLMMPGINGWELCKMIRSFSKVPIIIISALDDSTSIASGLDAGANEYLFKPISVNILIACINKLTRDDYVQDK